MPPDSTDSTEVARTVPDFELSVEVDRVGLLIKSPCDQLMLDVLHVALRAILRRFTGAKISDAVLAQMRHAVILKLLLLARENFLYFDRRTGYWKLRMTEEEEAAWRLGYQGGISALAKTALEE